MKKAVLRAPRVLVIVEAPMPEPGPGEALVRVRAGGVCGSDVHAFRGSSAFQVYPNTPGHEIAGEVAALGEGVTNLSPGEHVVLDPMIRCGHCYPCRLGRYNCCTTLRVMGVHAEGGFAEYVAVGAARLHRIGANVPFRAAAMVEPLSVSAHAVARGRVSEADHVLVIGAGTIGLGALLMARLAGATVAVSDPLPEKLRLAQRLGADLAIDPGERDVQEAVQEWTAEDGASVVIEAVGDPRTTRVALDYVSFAGRVVIVGITREEVPFPVPLLVRKELDVVASRNSREQFPRVVSLIESGQIDPAPLISHDLPFERLAEAFAMIAERPNEVRKVVLSFG